MASYVHNTSSIQALQAVQVVLNRRRGRRRTSRATQKPVVIQLLSKSLYSVLYHYDSRTIESLLDLPTMTDPTSLAAVQLLSHMVSACYITAPNLIPIIVSTMVTLSIREGNSMASCVSYVTYGGILCVGVGAIESGYRFGSLAVQLVERIHATAVQTKVICLFNTYIRPWKEHLRVILPQLLQGYHIGLETGDFEYAGYNLHNYTFLCFCSGNDLGLLAHEMETYYQPMVQLKQHLTADWFAVLWQCVLNLVYPSDQPHILDGWALNEQKLLSRHPIGEFYLFLFKLMLSYLFEQQTSLLDIATTAEQRSTANPGRIEVALVCFYAALARLRLYPDASTIDKSTLMEKVATSQQQLHTWAHHAPMNFLHKWHLIEAERYQVLGDPGPAWAHYQDAIAGAHEHGYIQEEALAYELLGRFLLAQGQPESAVVVLRQAHSLYHQWGATAKACHIEKNYPHLFSLEPAAFLQSSSSFATRQAGTTSNNATSTTLDLTSVLKASQAISGEIVLETLLARLMHVLVENAAADRGVLVLHHDQEWVIEAEEQVEQATTTVLQSQPLSDTTVPLSVLTYVSRTCEHVVLHDARQAEPFEKDPYIQQQQPRAILCLPLLHQGNLIGLLYLENHLTAGVFTAERLQVLHLLSGQVAISLENARLYTLLEQKVAQRTQELSETITTLQTTQQRLIEAEKMAALGNLVAGVAHEINTPVGVGITAASLLEQRTSTLSQRYRQAQMKRSDLEKYLELASQSSQMILVNLQRAAELIKGFKQVAVDQTSEERRTFAVKAYLEEIVRSLHPQLQRTRLMVTIEGNADITLNSYPGALSQIVTNLVVNSITHAYAPGQTGHLSFALQQRDTTMIMRYGDDGQGIPPDHLGHIFEPFFTTRRGQGGSGLGLHIVYNLVTQKLGGTIRCESERNHGTRFVIEVPTQEPPDGETPQSATDHILHV